MKPSTEAADSVTFFSPLENLASPEVQEQQVDDAGVRINTFREILDRLREWTKVLNDAHHGKQPKEFSTLLQPWLGIADELTLVGQVSDIDAVANLRKKYKKCHTRARAMLGSAEPPTMQ